MKQLKGNIMEVTNTILFAGYGTVLFMLTGLAIYFSERLFTQQS